MILKKSKKRTKIVLSSTNRNHANKRHIADYYVTPISEIELFLKEFQKATFLEWKSKLILDPTAGGSENCEMSYPKALKNIFQVNNIKTIDIRENSKAEVIADYIQYDLGYQADIIVSNPPFNQALEVIKKGLLDLKDNGWLIMLLRLNFLESVKRKAFFDCFMPQYIFVHHKRMSFIESKGTDSVAYAHFCWQKNHYPKFSKIRVI